ncbi:MAG: methylmalonyl Co-A mutase-associated GTPase MeaB [Candidatus Obscuribacterales bacterium]
MASPTLKFSLEDIAEQLKAGNKRALARALSIVEDGGPRASWLVRKLFPDTGKAHLIGITGSPGVGKSTLVDALIAEIRDKGKKVGVIAIDPTSPFTGGAILGDRIRMQGHALDKNVFIRSMANRGHAGGIALATYDAIRMMEAYGCEVVIIETVGVGQSELAIAKTADTTVLVLMPGSGDDVQAIKSGIMEIGDVFVINKADLPGANKTASEIMQTMELSHSKTECHCPWKPPVLMTIAENNEGIAELWEKIQHHGQYLEESETKLDRRRMKMQAELSELVAELARNNLDSSLESSSELRSLLTDLLHQKGDPHSAAEEIVHEIFNSSQGSKAAP